MTIDDASRDSEAFLVRRAQKGSSEAFETLLSGVERRVYATAWKMLGNREDARDAVQEVYLRVYRFLDRLDPDRPLGAWVHRITVNVCRDQFGRRARRRTESLPEQAPESVADPDPASDPHQQALASERRRRLAEALRHLPERQSLALILRDVHGLTTREVARQMGSSEVTVRSQISRARLRLRKWREEHE